MTQSNTRPTRRQALSGIASAAAFATVPVAAVSADTGATHDDDPIRRQILEKYKPEEMVNHPLFDRLTVAAINLEEKILLFLDAEEELGESHCALLIEADHLLFEVFALRNPILASCSWGFDVADRRCAVMYRTLARREQETAARGVQRTRFQMEQTYYDRLPAVRAAKPTTAPKLAPKENHPALVGMIFAMLAFEESCLDLLAVADELHDDFSHIPCEVDHVLYSVLRFRADVSAVLHPSVAVSQRELAFWEKIVRRLDQMESQDIEPEFLQTEGIYFDQARHEVEELTDVVALRRVMDSSGTADDMERIHRRLIRLKPETA